MKKILICTGGTGGHIFPAISLAQYLEKKKFNVDLITDYRAKRFINNLNLRNITFINVQTPTGKKGLGLIYSLFLIFFSFLYSVFFLLFKKPQLIIGSGGYASFPVLLAAKLLKKKFVIYETNSVVGRVNKFFLNSSIKIFTGYPLKHLNINNDKINFVGQLIREQIYAAKEKNDLKKDNNFDFTLLVIGGSQGAEIFSKTLPKSLNKLFSLNKKIRIFHQSGNKEQETKIDFSYKKNSNVTIFNFEPNIEKYMMVSDLVITRAGSSTLSELAFLQIPFIAIPFKNSLDNHQFYNAEYFFRMSACWLIDQQELNSEKLFDLVKDLIINKEKLLEKKSKLKELTKTNVNEIFEKEINNLL
ncbi:MAG: UDP-N-acetylglucosamine--N-acetylmuramyl-(pentapeptide) pyrophosphoryl-undecaprenol N-acetylglucosamine transferase [Proteobacteria bacterium]|jgi:UDP-N-acetylglucosamine--N-acetylmuramyl-(pentapeptide) pyrophosphoryl-undecaprenol N-acetylglucosamine transferase|nr:UDP-N-acetylglucosamine--N-acetylmuramyl-(pentapeptide) pyrophosphoryl-undecaprenol N-acetylglucosamine transferase [Candidatus Fonsibacter sp. PEL3]